MPTKSEKQPLKEDSGSETAQWPGLTANNYSSGDPNQEWWDKNIHMHANMQNWQSSLPLTGHIIVQEMEPNIYSNVFQTIEEERNILNPNLPLDKSLHTDAAPTPPSSFFQLTPNWWQGLDTRSINMHAYQAPSGEQQPLPGENTPFPLALQSLSTSGDPNEEWWDSQQANSINNGHKDNLLKTEQFPPYPFDALLQPQPEIAQEELQHSINYTQQYVYPSTLLQSNSFEYFQPQHREHLSDEDETDYSTIRVNLLTEQGIHRIPLSPKDKKSEAKLTTGDPTSKDANKRSHVIAWDNENRKRHAWWSKWKDKKITDEIVNKEMTRRNKASIEIMRVEKENFINRLKDASMEKLIKEMENQLDSEVMRQARIIIKSESDITQQEIEYMEGENTIRKEWYMEKVKYILGLMLKAQSQLLDPTDKSSQQGLLSNIEDSALEELAVSDHKTGDPTSKDANKRSHASAWNNENKKRSKWRSKWKDKNITDEIVDKEMTKRNKASIEIMRVETENFINRLKDASMGKLIKEMKNQMQSESHRKTRVVSIFHQQEIKYMEEENTIRKEWYMEKIKYILSLMLKAQSQPDIAFSTATQREIDAEKAKLSKSAQADIRLRNWLKEKELKLQDTTTDRNVQIIYPGSSQKKQYCRIMPKPQPTEYIMKKYDATGQTDYEVDFEAEQKPRPKTKGSLPSRKRRRNSPEQYAANPLPKNKLDELLRKERSNF